MLRCGDVPLPIALAPLMCMPAEAIPTDADLEDVWPQLSTQTEQRLIVVGSDAAFAAVLTRLLRTERLQIALALVPDEDSIAAKVYRIGTGAAAATRALQGKPKEHPLIRDDTGVALVGTATITGPQGGAVEGEAYVDDTKLFTGTVAALHVSPCADMPGVRARVERGPLRRGRWVSGRAVQLGSSAAVVERDGIPSERPVRRSAFYRHHEPWLLVR
ncbi:hypothetical protein FOS14_20610 [Skermania sp. ID1734]|nr:hypothetical protein FOS14_20610 [Skermania sp. ID1734]